MLLLYGSKRRSFIWESLYMNKLRQTNHKSKQLLPVIVYVFITQRCYNDKRDSPLTPKPTGRDIHKYTITGHRQDSHIYTITIRHTQIDRQRDSHRHPDRQTHTQTERQAHTYPPPHTHTHTIFLIQSSLLRSNRK